MNLTNRSSESPLLDNVNNATESSKLKFYYENAGGFGSKGKRLLTELSCTDRNVVCLTETWLNETHLNNEFFPNEFTVYRQDRCATTSIKKRGGGVLIAINKHIRSEEVALAAAPDINCLCVKIHSKNGHLYIYLGYIPPKGNENISTHTETYRKHLDCISSINLEHNDKLLVLGDYNIPGIPWFFDDELNCYFPTKISGEIADCFLNGMMELGLFQLCNITNKCDNVLDYVYASEPLSIQVIRAPSSLTAAAENSANNERFHYPLEWEILTEKRSQCPIINTKIKCFKKADFNLINEAWTDFDVCTITSAPTIEMAELAFYDKMNDCINRFVPSFTPKKFSANHPPWFDRKLINLKNRRDKARKRISITRSTTEFDEINLQFTAYNNLRIGEYQLEQNSLCRDNPRKFWNYINSHRKTRGYPDCIQFDERVAENENDAAELFNEFFASVFEDEDPSFSINEYLNHHSTSDTEIDRITLEETLHELSTLDETKGAGLDGIHPIILKRCASSLAKAVCALFNKSIECCEVPKNWKKMQIIPIFKSGKKSSVKQYRPIAIPPVLGKVQDKLMTKRLNIALEGKISIHQHGFVKKRNTSTNVMELTQHGFAAFEQKAQLDVFYADLSKAFDKVKHSMLIKKLNMLRVSKQLLKWQWSFLTGRTQRTKIGNQLSSEIEITSGIIQGGHQSPICFDAFINDLPELIKCAIIENFADDTKLFAIIKSIEDAIKLQLDIDTFLQWCSTNSLELNKSKCYMMTLSQKNNIIKYDYNLHGHVIERVTEHRDLGILIDSKLSMIPHIDRQVNKAMGTLSLIRRLSGGFFSTETIRNLYMCLVRSHLDYASSVFNPNYEVHSNKIESVQKQFLLFALNHEERSEDHRLRPYHERCQDLKLTSLHRRRINSGIFFLYDLIENNLVTSSLNDRIQFRDNLNYNTRNKDLINIPIVTKNYLYNNPFLVMCRNFNKIGDIFLSSQSRLEFIAKVKNVPDELFI